MVAQHEISAQHRDAKRPTPLSLLTIFKSLAEMLDRSKISHMAFISFQILSDLHLETPAARPTYSQFSFARTSPHLVLLGDIGVTHDSRLLSWLREQLEKFETVIYVLGNHEPYDTTFVAAKGVLRALESEVTQENARYGRKGNFILLDQDRYDIEPTLTVLGCTLFSAIDLGQASSVRMFVSDFERIQAWDIDSHNGAHASDLNWLNEQVASITRSEPESTLR